MNIPCIILHFYILLTLHRVNLPLTKRVQVSIILYKNNSKEERNMNMRTVSNISTVSCPVSSCKAVVSYAFVNAVRFFSALRFYYYYYYCNAILI